LGLSTANSLAAVAAGARQVECTVNGIGERAGNTSLEELVMILRTRGDRYPFHVAVGSEQLFPASQLLSEITGVGVQPNKAVVGRNAFAHEAGIHQDGMIKNARTYEIMTPESVGVPGTRLVLGKHSGRHALALRCEELGFPLERRDLDAVYHQFVLLADSCKAVADHQILELIHRQRNRRPEEVVASSADGVAPVHGPHHESLATQFPLSYLAKGAGAGIDGALRRCIREQDGEQQEDYLWGV